MTPYFLEGTKGKIFALQYSPQGAPRANIVFLAPFCEEMNRCRHLVSAQAKSFERMGYMVLVVDPYGTGDSQGDLIDADWITWSLDAVMAADWLLAQTDRDTPTILWGLRLGGLLAIDLAARNPSLFKTLLLWQPVMNGKTYITQILRQRLAHLVERSLPPESTDSMREHLYSGGTVEVGGYVIGGALVEAVDALKVPQPLSPADCNIHWLQQAHASGNELPVAMERQIAGLRDRGNMVDLQLFEAPPIWQLHERADASSLLASTNSLELQLQ